MFGHKRGEELRHALQAALRRELLDALNQPVKMLRRRCDHRDGDIRHLANATHHMVRGYQDNPGIGDGGSRGGIATACEGDRLGKALALGQDMKNRFVAGGRDPVQLDPAIDDDKERRRRLALPEQGIAGFEIDDSCRRKKGLHRPRIETAEHGRL